MALRSLFQSPQVDLRFSEKSKLVKEISAQALFEKLVTVAMPWDPGQNGWWNGAIVHVLAGSLRNTCLTGVSHEDAHKLQYAVDAAAWMENPFENKNVLDTPLFKALLWQAGKSAKEIMDHREAMVSQIELAAEELQLSGLRLQGALQMLVPPRA